ASAHTRQEKFKTDASAATVEQVPFVTNHECNPAEETWICTEHPGERLRSRDHHPDALKPLKFVSCWHGAAVCTPCRDAHCVQLLDERLAKFGCQGTVRHKQHCDGSVGCSSVPVQQCLA